MTSTNTPEQSQISIITANSIGIDCAREWLDRAPDAVLPPASLAAWRARCYADSVHEYENHIDFLQLLDAWGQGFDQTAHSGAIAAEQCERTQPATQREHKPFSWLADDLRHDYRAQFVALTMDVCNGIETCLELFHSSELKRDCGQDGALTRDDAARLLRLAMTSARMLAESADADIDNMNERATRSAS